MARAEHGAELDAPFGRGQLAALFDDHYDSVYRYCLARSGSVATAEDIASEVFVELARRIAHGPAESYSVGSAPMKVR